jgi:hypothetical protein
VTDEQQRLFRAYSAAYGLENKHRTFVIAVDGLFAVLGVVFALAGSDTALLVAAALAWLLIRSYPDFLKPDKHRREAVAIQEQFDLSFGGVQSNEALWGGPPQPHRIDRLAARCRELSVDEDYWVNTKGLPDRVGALLRQKQSAAWAQDGHERYARFNMAVVAVAVFALAALAWTLDLDFADALVAVFAPAAPLLVGRVQSAQRNRAHSGERKEIDQSITDVLTPGGPDPPATFVRAIQDRLYYLRLGGRIPTWFYKLFKTSDQNTIDVSVQRLADDLRSRLA